MILAASQQPMPDVAISTEPTRQETTVPKTCMLSPAPREHFHFQHKYCQKAKTGTNDEFMCLSAWAIGIIRTAQKYYNCVYR
jgi:hypothetical protein